MSPKPAAEVRPSRLGRLVNERALLGMAGVAGVLIVWEAAVRLGLVKSVLISRPSAVAAAGLDAFTSGTIFPAIGATLIVWVAGFTLASVAGIALGLLGGISLRFRYLVTPWLNISYVAPDLAFVPILILWFGIGLGFKIVLVFITAVFYIAINTLAGVEASEAKFLTVAHSFNASRLLVMRTVTLPGSVPYIITGLRQGASRAIVAVIVAEFVSSTQGIGFMIAVSGQFLETANVMFGIVLLAVFGIAVNEVLTRIDRRFDAWRPARNANR
ncbi:MAG TPA: ABC transporter permease [Candidatus Limnocylindrales bacterium]|nr:ABC transporter permease [Candidatus Limnocylindrales bacterium]